MTAWLRHLHRTGGGAGARRHLVLQIGSPEDLLESSFINSALLHSGVSLFALTSSHAFLTSASDTGTAWIWQTSTGSSPTPTGALPVDVINSVTSYLAPSLRPRYRGLTTTTGRSAAGPASVPRPLTVAAAWALPLHRPGGTVADREWAFPRSLQPQQTRLASPSCRTPPGQSAGSRQAYPGDNLKPRFRCRVDNHLDTSSAIHSRSPFWSPPDTSPVPSPHRSPPRPHDRSSMRWFEPSHAGRLGRVGVVADHEPLVLTDLDLFDPQVLRDLLVAALAGQGGGGLGASRSAASPRGCSRPRRRRGGAGWPRR